MQEEQQELASLQEDIAALRTQEGSLPVYLLTEKKKLKAARTTAENKSQGCFV